MIPAMAQWPQNQHKMTRNYPATSCLRAFRAKVETSGRARFDDGAGAFSKGGKGGLTE